MKFLRILWAMVVVSALVPVALAYTDPTPDPFAALQPDETVYMGTITATDGTTLTAVTESGKSFTAPLSSVFRYRATGAAALAKEFSVGDIVRFIGTTLGGVTALQDADLVRCGDSLTGWVQRVFEGSWVFLQHDHTTLTVLTGPTTQYRDAQNAVLTGYVLKVGDTVALHGTCNMTAKKAYIETLGSYVTLLPAVPMPQISFSDVPDAASYARAVAYLQGKQVVTGYADGTYRPDQLVTRAEFVTMLLRLHVTMTPTVPTAPCFTDTPVEAWYTPYVCAARDAKIVAGYADGTYLPAAPVTTAEATKMVIATYGLTLPTHMAESAWYAPYLYTAQVMHLLPDGAALPAAPVTRALLAELLTRTDMYSAGELLDYLAGK